MIHESECSSDHARVNFRREKCFLFTSCALSVDADSDGLWRNWFSFKARRFNKLSCIGKPVTFWFILMEIEWSLLEIWRGYLGGKHRLSLLCIVFRSHMRARRARIKWSNFDWTNLSEFRWKWGGKRSRKNWLNILQHLATREREKSFSAERARRLIVRKLLCFMLPAT